MAVADDTYWERLAAVSGLAGLTLTVVGTFIVGSPPAADATMERIRQRDMSSRLTCPPPWILDS